VSTAARFKLALGSSSALVAIYILWTTQGLGGATLTIAAEDLGEALVAIVAAAACAWAAWRGTAQTRVAWGLFAGSALAWAAGEVVWSLDEVGLGIDVPFPSAADCAFLAAIPLAVAGVLNLPSAPSTTSGRMRLVLDGGIVAASLIFVAWAVGLSDLYGRSSIDQPAKLLVLAYPAGDLMLLTLIGAALRRASGQAGVVLWLLFGSALFTLVSDGSFAYLLLRGAYGAQGSAADAGWVAGYLAMALAAWRSRGVRAEAPDASQMEVWRLAIPWLAVLAVLVTSLWVTLSGRHFGAAMAFIGTGLGALFVASQALSATDLVRLLRRTVRAEAQLRERTGLLGEIIGRAPLGIARIGDDLRFLDANPRLSEMLAIPAQALAGASLLHFVAPDEVAGVNAGVTQMRRDALTEAEVDSEMVRADGRKMWVHRTVAPVFNSDGTVHYYLTMFEDISARHQQEQAALANLAALERLSNLKSEFMSMVSHEFRTALTGIQGYSELMSSEEVAPTEVKEFAGDINADAMRLNRMITEMLDLDRIESGRMTMRLERFDLNQVLRDAVDRTRMSTDKHTIALDLDGALPAIEGDRDRLTQVVTNLLSNAVKYSPNGGEIVVGSHVRESHVEVSVRDHGQGIPPEFTSRIFGRYERYDGGKNQPVGTGLGLAIAQQIINLHKGRIWVEGAPTGGSTFRFALPAVMGSSEKVA
jgi:two-component system, sensor histidine kinase and response regulator